jgi:DNA-binding response OmpR family regulator
MIECGIIPQPDQPCTVLAVNLDCETRSSLDAVLSGSRWILKPVTSFGEAVAYAVDRTVRIVLCEPNMSDGNWYSLMDRLRRVPDPPLLIVACRLADERFWAEVLNLGGYDVLATPFDRSEVLRVLFLAWTASRRTSGWPPRSQWSFDQASVSS